MIPNSLFVSSLHFTVTSSDICCAVFIKIPYFVYLAFLIFRYFTLIMLIIFFLNLNLCLITKHIFYLLLCLVRVLGVAEVTFNQKSANCGSVRIKTFL